MSLILNNWAQISNDKSLTSLSCPLSSAVLYYNKIKKVYGYDFCKFLTLTKALEFYAGVKRKEVKTETFDSKVWNFELVFVNISIQFISFLHKFLHKYFHYHTLSADESQSIAFAWFLR